MVGLNETFYYNSCLCEGTCTSLENRTQALRALKTNIEKKLTSYHRTRVQWLTGKASSATKGKDGNSSPSTMLELKITTYCNESKWLLFL